MTTFNWTIVSVAIIFFNMSSIPTYSQVNYDESKIPTYELPELLISENGKEIKNEEDWWKIRRPEILSLFASEVFGKLPARQVKTSAREKMTLSNALDGQAVQKEVVLTFTNGENSHNVNMLLFLPANHSGPVPLFLGMNFYGNHTIHSSASISLPDSYVANKAEFCIFENKATHESRGVRANRWPVERIIERGYGLAVIYYGDVDPDFDDGFQNGIHPLYYEKGQKNPAPEEWGSIAAWAYSLSVAMDYFETASEIDQERIAVIGHSRLGKTALWAGATDQRFAMVISNDSGCGGAALSRRRIGETVEAINNRFPHWFCKNFHAYNGKEDNLPIDQHMLLALMAPRPIYVASAKADDWADPKGEFLSLYHAGSAYELFGLDNFPSNEMPTENNPLVKDRMAYHIRSGQHDLTKYDWERYLDFADLHLKGEKD